MLYEPSLGQELNAVAIGASIERDGKVELGGIESDSGAGDRYPFRVARELKLGCRRPETLKRQIAVAQDVDFAVLDASVHPAGHLENLVRPEVGPCQHVLAALHDVRVPRIVDHNGIQPPDIEGGLARSSHRQQKRSFDQTVKKRSNDADWLATVVERRGEVGPAVTKLLQIGRASCRERVEGAEVGGVVRGKKSAGSVIE